MQVLEPSTCIAHYCLLRRIARGGMSHVYLAQDVFTEQLVALKLVDRNQSEHCERLQREIGAVAELIHDHILPALDYGPYYSWHYLATPYIEHGTLRERLTQGPLTIKEAGNIHEQIASALQFAHEHGIVHRDVKPSNILLRDGEHAYLTDFGLVKLIDEASDITQTGCMLGTPTYMAPELVEHDATPRSDIYALGIVLYQMLTGHIPFESTTPIGVYWKHLSESPVPPSTHNPAISPAIDAVVLHALEKNPQQRFGSASEFAQAYQQALGGGQPIAPTHRYAATVGRHRCDDTSKHAPTVRKTSAILAAVIFFFITPLWLGFTFYSFHYRSQPSAIMHAGAPLTVDHLPAVLVFPPIPPLHQTPVANTEPPQPPPTSSSSSWFYQSPSPHQSPPPHKHRHKHKDGDEQDQEQKHQAEDISA